MRIYEPRSLLEVETPKGKGIIWLVTEYSTEQYKVFSVIINNTGEIWEFTSKDIKVTKNITMGRNYATDTTTT